MIEHSNSSRVPLGKSEHKGTYQHSSYAYDYLILGRRNDRNIREKDGYFDAIFELETMGRGFAARKEIATLIFDNSTFSRSQAYARLNHNLHQFSPRAPSAFTSLNLNRQKGSK